LVEIVNAIAVNVFFVGYQCVEAINSVCKYTIELQIQAVRVPSTAEYKLEI
jgi:hypothetical protein